MPNIVVGNIAGAPSITINGRFDFSAHKEFRAACEQVMKMPGSSLELDMGNVKFIDSSALGMLLLLKDQADGDGRAVILTNTPAAVRSILEVANFHKLLTIR